MVEMDINDPYKATRMTKLRAYSESCDSLDSENECDQYWTNIDYSDISNYTLDNKMVGTPVMCVNKDPTNPKDYIQRNGAVSVGNTKIGYKPLKIEGSDTNGCINNLDISAAKNKCNGSTNCDGFYIYDVNSPSRVCFKSDIINSDSTKYTTDNNFIAGSSKSAVVHKNNNKCTIRNKYTTNKLKLSDHFWADQTYTDATNDIKYCPTYRNLDYKIDKGVSNIGSAINTNLTNIPNSDSNGCINNITGHEAKDICDNSKNCDGYYIYDLNNPSRVCFKTNIINDGNKEQIDGTSAMIYKNKYNIIDGVSGYTSENNLSNATKGANIRSINLVNGFGDTTAVDNRGCINGSNIKNAQELCDNNYNCDGFVVSDTQTCFITSLNTELNPIYSKSKKLYAKDIKWKDVLNKSRTFKKPGSNFNICAEQCIVDNKGKIVENQQGCVFSNSDNKKYIHMGHPVSGTDWCPSNYGKILNNTDFTIPSYKLETAIKKTVNYNNSNTNKDSGINKCAILCDEHNRNTDSESGWKCTGYSTYPTKVVPEYDFSKTTKNDPLGNNYVCNLNFPTDFNKSQQWMKLNNKKKIKSCSSAFKQTCKPGTWICSSGNDYTPTDTDAVKICESYVQNSGVFNESSVPCMAIDDNIFGGSINCVPKPGVACEDDYYLKPNNADYQVRGNECQLHGAYMEPFKSYERAVDTSKFNDENNYQINGVDKIVRITDTTHNISYPEMTQSNIDTFKKTGCIDSIDIDDAKNYCINEQYCDGFYTTQKTRNGKTCFINFKYTDLKQNPISDSNLFLGSHQIENNIDNKFENYDIIPNILGFKNSQNSYVTLNTSLTNICKTDKQKEAFKCHDLIKLLTTSDTSDQQVLDAAYTMCNSCTDTDCRNLVESIASGTTPSPLNINKYINTLNESMGGCTTLDSETRSENRYTIETGGCIDNISNKLSAELCDKDYRSNNGCSGFYTYDISANGNSRTCFKKIANQTLDPTVVQVSDTSNINKNTGFFLNSNINSKNTNNPTMYVKNDHISKGSHVTKGIRLDSTNKITTGYYNFEFSDKLKNNIAANLEFPTGTDYFTNNYMYSINNPPPKDIGLASHSQKDLSLLHIDFNKYDNITDGDNTQRSCLFDFNLYNNYDHNNEPDDSLDDSLGQHIEDSKRIYIDETNNCYNGQEDSETKLIQLSINNVDLKENGCLYKNKIDRPEEPVKVIEKNPIACEMNYFKWDIDDVNNISDSKYILPSDTGFGKCRWNPGQIVLSNGSEINGFCDYIDKDRHANDKHGAITVNKCNIDFTNPSGVCGPNKVDFYGLNKKDILDGCTYKQDRNGCNTRTTEDNKFKCESKYFDWDDNTIKKYNHNWDNLYEPILDTDKKGKCVWDDDKQTHQCTSTFNGEKNKDGKITSASCTFKIGENANDNDCAKDESKASNKLTTFAHCDNIDNKENCLNSFYKWNENLYPCEWTGTSCKGTNSKVDTCTNDSGDDKCCYNQQDPTITTPPPKNKVTSSTTTKNEPKSKKQLPNQDPLPTKKLMSLTTKIILAIICFVIIGIVGSRLLS